MICHWLKHELQELLIVLVLMLFIFGSYFSVWVFMQSKDFSILFQEAVNISNPISNSKCTLIAEVTFGELALLEHKWADVV